MPGKRQGGEPVIERLRMRRRMSNGYTAIGSQDYSATLALILMTVGPGGHGWFVRLALGSSQPHLASPLLDGPREGF